MAPLYHYQLHHFTVSSTFALPELLPIPAQAVDIIIVEGAVPESLGGTTKGSLWDGELEYEFTPNTTLLALPEVGRFLIRDNKAIIVQRDEGVSYDDLRHCTLGTCLGFLLIRRGVFPFHGSTVRTPYGTVMFIAPSGWGKSTTAAKFVLEGHALLTDDVCVVRPDPHGRFVAYPFSFRLRLWEDSIEALELDSAQFVPNTPDGEKRLHHVKEQLAQTPEPLVAIYELWPEDDAAPEVQNLDKYQQVATLAANTFREEAVGLFGLGPQHFAFCSAVARAVPVKRLRRPESTFSIDALYRLVMEDLQDTVHTYLTISSV